MQKISSSEIKKKIKKLQRTKRDYLEKAGTSTLLFDRSDEEKNEKLTEINIRQLDAKIDELKTELDSHPKKTHFSLINVVLVILLTGIIGIIVLDPIGRLYNKIFLDPTSDTHVFVYGYEHSYDLYQLKEFNSDAFIINYSRVKFPDGIDTIDHNLFIEAIDWKGKEGKKLFVVVAENRGEIAAKDIKITISVGPYLIDSISIKNKNRLEVIEGGYASSRVVVLANELLSGERQYFEIISSAKEMKSIQVLADDTDIEKVFVYDVSITPARSNEKTED